jgi:hypothetical protein
MAFTPRTWGHQHHRLAPRRQPPRRRAAEPRLERLEDRTVLSTLTVLNNSDSGLGSLRYTIAAARSGDTIIFAPKLLGGQTITLGSELKIGKSLDIEGPGAENLIISGKNASRVFDIQSGTVTIAGMTITDGLANGSSPVLPSEGGGVLNQASLTLSNDVLSNNQAIGDPTVSPAAGGLGNADGGGIANLGALTVTTCQFINNQALGADGSGSSGGTALLPGRGLGAGIYNPAQASVKDSVFAGNVARGGKGCRGNFGGEGVGGGIANPNPTGTLSVIGSTFRDNQAIGGNDNVGDTLPGTAEGGAISSGGASLSVTESTFDHNQAIGGNGNQVTVPEPAILGPNVAIAGAVGILGGIVTIGDSTFDHNQALGGQGAAGSVGGVGVGGGIAVLNFFAPPPPQVVIVTVGGCTVDHNSAIGGPGGSGGNGGNGGDGWGGGFANLLGATLTVSGTTVDHNMARGGHGGAGGNGGNGLGGGLYNDASSTLALTGATVEYNLALGGGNGGLGIGGGVYNNNGVFTPVRTVIKGNHASTSNDNIFP